MNNEMYYCILRNQKNNKYEVKEPVSDDTVFFKSVSEANSRGNSLQTNSVPYSAYKSIETIKNEGDPDDYEYEIGLFDKYP